ncbi:MAG TPA: SH3 domain-containing protein [Caldilineaceae bacterium]|nr:SH3 domain-containing protein [Caldilineaceae bacterium]
MHAQPQRTLKRLIKQYGPDLVNDPRRTEALLNDLCGQHRREIFVLINAQKQRVPAELLAAPAWMPSQAVYARLSRQLQEKLALTQDAADWAVAAWAGALELTPTNGKSGWPWFRRAAPASPTSAPATPAKSKQKKRQTASVGVKYQTEPARPSKRRPPRHETREPAALRRILAWPLLRREPLLKLLVWGVVFAASVSLLILIVSEMRQPQSLAEPVGQVAPPATTEGQPDAEPPPAMQEPLPSGPAVTYLAGAYTLPRTAWVIAGPLLVRLEPSLNSGYLATLPERQAVRVDSFSEDGGWSHIFDPHTGWVSNEYLFFQSGDEAQEMVQLEVRRQRAPSPLAVRARPDLDAAVVGEVAAGAPVIAVAKRLDGSWLHVVYPVAGWVSAHELPPAP